MYYAYDLWQVIVFIAATSSGPLPNNSSIVDDKYPVTPITAKSFQISLSGIFRYQVYQVSVYQVSSQLLEFSILLG